jgi:hypothetical protein
MSRVSTEHCPEVVWSAGGYVPEVDAEACFLKGPMPRCPNCGALARPHILTWHAESAERQVEKLQGWLGLAEALVVVEVGAGTGLPTVRSFSKRMALGSSASMLASHLSIRGTGWGWLDGRALEVLQELDTQLGSDWCTGGRAQCRCGQGR